MNKPLNSATAHALLGIAARLDLVRLETIGDTAIMAISEPWKIAVLTVEPGIITAATPARFEAALQDAAASGIFVPKYSFGYTQLQRILARHASSTTIYWEE